MASYLITYDLNEETSRPNITKIVKGFKFWAKLSESSYAVDASDTPSEIYKKFKKVLDDNDTLYVIALTRPYMGQGSKEVNDWLETHLTQ